MGLHEKCKRSPKKSALDVVSGVKHQTLGAFVKEPVTEKISMHDRLLKALDSKHITNSIKVKMARDILVEQSTKSKKSPQRASRKMRESKK
jgi:hypothetical protein